MRQRVMCFQASGPLSKMRKSLQSGLRLPGDLLTIVIIIAVQYLSI